MIANKIDSFNEKAEVLFRPYMEKYGYSLDQVIINYLNGDKWSTHHIYLNNKKNLKVILKQEPYYTDYGFSFFLINTNTEEYNILCNVPHEKQDPDDNFLTKAWYDLFSNDELMELLNGKTWKELKSIPLQF